LLSLRSMSSASIILPVVDLKRTSATPSYNVGDPLVAITRMNLRQPVTRFGKSQGTCFGALGAIRLWDGGKREKKASEKAGRFIASLTGSRTTSSAGRARSG